MNVGEWGLPFVFSTGFDMSAFTTIKIEFTKPDGTALTVTSPSVTVPAFDITTTLGIFLANKYAKYIFADGDVDQVGTWSARVVYDDATPQHLISDVGAFLVNS